MSLVRREFLRLATGAATIPMASQIVRAIDYPTRPVHLLVGWAPGGFTDITARLIAPWLSDRLGQQFVVENRPGASSNLATAGVARAAAADGYTLLMINDAHATNVA